MSERLGLFPFRQGLQATGENTIGKPHGEDQKLLCEHGQSQQKDNPPDGLAAVEDLGGRRRCAVLPEIHTEHAFVSRQRST
jgi:hypothetical protein